jgi:hypothetical protein
MIALLIYVLIACIVLWGLWYIVGTFVPEPLKKPATAVLVILGLIVLIYILLQFAGGGMPVLHMRR